MSKCKYDVRVTWHGWTNGSGWNLDAGEFDKKQQADNLPNTNREVLNYLRFVMEYLDCTNDEAMLEALAEAEVCDVQYVVEFRKRRGSSRPDTYSFWRSELAERILQKRHGD